MTEQRRYCYVLDNGKSTFYDLNKKDILQMYQVEDLLNEQEEEIKELEKCREELFIRERDTKNECRELKERNQRQYERLKELTELMYERQWGKLEDMVEEWEKADKLLQAEWRCY